MSTITAPPVTDRLPVHFAEIDTDGMSTTTRVILAIVRVPSSSGEGDYPVVAGLVTFDTDQQTIEVVRVDDGWRRQGIGKALVAAAEFAAGVTLGPSREFSRPGKALWRSLGRPVPRGSYSAGVREGESYGAMLMAVVLGQLIGGGLTTRQVLTEQVHEACGGVTVKAPA